MRHSTCALAQQDMDGSHNASACEAFVLNLKTNADPDGSGLCNQTNSAIPDLHSLPIWIWPECNTCGIAKHKCHMCWQAVQRTQTFSSRAAASLRSGTWQRIRSQCPVSSWSGNCATSSRHTRSGVANGLSACLCCMLAGAFLQLAEPGAAGL